MCIFFPPKDIAVTSLFNFFFSKTKEFSTYKEKINIYIIAIKMNEIILSPIMFSMKNVSHIKDNFIFNCMLN